MLGQLPRVRTFVRFLALVPWLLAINATPAAAGDYFLHTATTDTLDQISPTATTAKFKDSSAVTRTTYQPVGTWAATPATPAQRLESLGALHVWVGLKNSDDQGTYFDLRAEVRKNGVVVASGEAKNIQGVTRNPDLAKEVVVTLALTSPVTFNASDVLSLRLLTKVADSGGHANAVGLRAYYDAVSRPSRVGLTLGPAAPPLSVTITSPLPGSVLDQPTVLVRGEVTSALDVGVTVNGLVAAVGGGQFAALVPVDASLAWLTVTATDASGATASASVAVTGQPAGESAVALRPVPPGGVAPLTVGFSLSSLVPVAQVALDLAGTGAVDFQGPSLDGQSFIYGTPGLYLPRSL